MKTDAKIDMLHRSGLFGKTPGKAKADIEDMREEHDVDMSLVSISFMSNCRLKRSKFGNRR